MHFLKTTTIIIIIMSAVYVLAVQSHHYRAPPRRKFQFIPRSRTPSGYEEELSFKFAARDLESKDRFGKSDPYVVIEYKDEKSPQGKDKEIGRTGIIQDGESPNWGEVFQVKYVSGTKQWIHVIIWDADAGPDDKIADTWINLNDYVKEHQHMRVNLNPGELLIDKVLLNR